jgi:hypothetical protein
LCGSEHFESLSFEGNNTEVCRFLIQSGSRPY